MRRGEIWAKQWGLHSYCRGHKSDYRWDMFTFPQATNTICFVMASVSRRLKYLPSMRSSSEILNKEAGDSHSDNISGCITGCVQCDRRGTVASGQRDRTDSRTTCTRVTREMLTRDFITHKPHNRIRGRWGYCFTFTTTEETCNCVRKSSGKTLQIVLTWSYW